VVLLDGFFEEEFLIAKAADIPCPWPTSVRIPLHEVVYGSYTAEKGELWLPF
jgi:hypothetical protein